MVAVVLVVVFDVVVLCVLLFAVLRVVVPGCGCGCGYDCGCILGRAAACRARAWHLFGPLLTQRRNLGFLCGPFPVEGMGNAPFYKFFVQYPHFFKSFLCILDVAYLNCHPFLPVFNRIYPFSILFSPHYGEPEKVGAM